MSDGERTLVDASGDVAFVVREGQPVEEPRWRSCRIVLTSERLVLSTNDGSQTVPHANSRIVDDAAVVPEAIDVGDATPLRVGDAVVLVDPTNLDDFAAEYRRAVLHDAIVLVTHEAVVGGVVQEDAAWTKGRVRFDEDRLVLGLPEGETAAIHLDDVDAVETATGAVRDEERLIVAVEYTDDGRVVQTRLSGTDRHARALSGLLEDVAAAGDEAVELTETERQVLMALYSGVSPFEMAEFVGIGIDEVEEIYGRLLDVGAVEKVRERTEVTLNARGRTLASEAMNEE